MATEKQTQANRNNAKRSTGPRTAEGKERASQNAVKHGLLAREAIIPGEDPADYEAQLAALEAELRPAGALERGFVRQFADAASIDNTRELAKLTHPKHLRPGNETLSLGTVMMRDAQSLVYFARYDAHLSRRFERAVQQLARLRDARENHQTEAIANTPHTPERAKNPNATGAHPSPQPSPPENRQTNPISSNPNNVNNIEPKCQTDARPAESNTHPNPPQNGSSQTRHNPTIPSRPPEGPQNPLSNRP